MKILLVCDQFYSANNGMTISARRFAAVLKMHGHEVRVLSYGNPEDVEDLSTAYLLKKQYIPMFDKLVASQGMTFAKYDEEVADRAVEWADVIHFLTPFVISHNVIKLAQKTGKPFTAAFHVQPENVTASIHLGKANFVNDCIYAWFKSFVFKYCSHIHCPSRFIANELEKHGYKQMLHVISNGIDPDFVYRKIPKKPEYANKFLIVSVGRMSIEKRQDLIISAVKKSKYFHQIKLVLAGKGPRKESLIALAKRLDVPVKIEFFSKSDLLDLLAMSDLYVHASDMEIEAMSCMEAFACGLVPIISNSAKSATPQFALDERSLFEAGNSDDLAKKIDYWVENNQERVRMEVDYSESAKKYSLDDCVRQAEEMFELAINESKNIKNENQNTENLSV